MLLSLRNIQNSKPLTNIEDDGSHVPFLPNSIELLGQSRNPMLTIKQLLMFCLNTILVIDVNSFMQLGNMQKSSAPYNTPDESMPKHS